MKNKFVLRTLLMAMVLFAPFHVNGQKSWHDFEIDLNTCGLITAEEMPSENQPSLSFGIAVGEDGTLTRVAADDPTATVVFNNFKYHSDHGFNPGTVTLSVPGNTRITYGCCTYGSDVTVTDATGNATVIPQIAACYKNGAENVASGLYVGEATTLTITGGSYTRYYKFEKVDEAIQEFTYTYDISASQATGVAPANGKVTEGNSFTIPQNRTLYLEGSTLTGWSDGETTYTIGQEITPTKNLTLTPVFTTNAVTLADRTETVTLNFDFQRKNGAPTVGWQGGTTTYPWVTQATIGESVIDVKMDCDVSNGKIANAGWEDWAQINSGTKLIIPACIDAVISLESYSPTTTTTIDGQVINQGVNTPSFTCSSKVDSIDIVIGDGSYWRYVKIELPVIEQSSAGKVYTDEAASVIWNFNTAVDYDKVSTVTPSDGFNTTAINFGDLTVTGTGTGQATDAEGQTVTFVKLKPGGNTKAIAWNVKPVKGLTFTPTKVSAYIQRFGTDAENGVVVTALLEDGTSEVLGTYTAPRNNKSQSEDKFGKNANYTNQFVIELTADQQTKLTTAGIFTLQATIGVGNTKEGGFSDVRIEGKLNGTIEDVAKYSLKAQASPTEAAEITIYPEAEVYDEGTKVTITATKNFGYKFVNWTDADGNVISEDAKFTHTIDSDIELTANYKTVNTYSLNYTIDGGANDYMVQPTPAPTVIDGKNMYEEGTLVVLTASSNPILTFTSWSNGETASELSFKMSENIDLVANYSAVDFIAGWDFYLPGNNGRPADFASADNDAAALVLRDADGNTFGWLDKSQAGAGGYEGRPGGVNWKNDVAIGTTYWQTMVNASAFTDIKVQTSMVYNYNAYQTYNAEYSLDGTTWEAIGQIKMTGSKNWTDGNFDLPKEADNQATVYLRWIADKSSKIDGTSSNNDGACIGATYITGTAKLINDGTAPKLVGTVPTEGFEGASANGKIVLTFDEKVKMAENAKGTIGTTELIPTVSGKTVIFEYKGLSYSTAYTFTLPANSVQDLTDNTLAEAITIHFTTKNKPVIEKALYDFVVPRDGTFKEAIDAANSREDKSKRYRIFVMKGNYIIPASETSTIEGSDGKPYPDPRTDLTASNTSIIGEDMETTTVKNTCPDVPEGTANPIEGLRKAYTLHNTGSGTYIQDLKLINGLNDACGRGEAYEESGDKTILKNVGLWGYQDTYCSNNGRGRYYIEGGVIRGRTDYICGKDDIFFNGVEFRNCGAGYIAVPSVPKKYGYIMRDCKITAEKGKESEVNGKYTLGRPWGSGTPIALWINTICEVLPSAVGWNEMSGGWPARFAEYNSMTSSGTTIDLSSRKTTFGDGHENNPRLTTDEAAFYTVTNVLGGDDDWDPTEYTEQASAPTNVKITDNVITWDNSNYVLCWAVCKDGKVIAFTTEPTYTIEDTNATYSIRAANEMGGLGEAAIVTDPSAIDEVTTGLQVISTDYYNMQGIKVSASYQGVIIKIEKLENGEQVVTKVINK